jgi:hypothetical protein
MAVHVEGILGLNGSNLDMWLTVPLIPRQSAARLAPNQSVVLLTSFALNPVLQPGTCCPSYRAHTLAMDVVSSWSVICDGLSKQEKQREHTYMQDTLTLWGLNLKHLMIQFLAVCLSVCLPIYLSTYGSIALVDLGRFFSFLIYTQSVGPLGRGISSSQRRYLHAEQRKHRTNAHRHPCLEWKSNPRFQCSNRPRRFMPQTARPLWWGDSVPTSQKTSCVYTKRSNQLISALHSENYANKRAWVNSFWQNSELLTLQTGAPNRKHGALKGRQNF